MNKVVEQHRRYEWLALVQQQQHHAYQAQLDTEAAHMHAVWADLLQYRVEDMAKEYGYE